MFTSPSQLKAYLGPKAFKRWSVRHPTAFGAPAPTPTARHTASKPTKTATSKPKPATTEPVAAPAVEATKSRPLLTLVLMALVMLGGLALLASAVVPARMAPVTLQRLYAEDPDRRMVAFAAATAILLGFGVSFYLS